MIEVAVHARTIHYDAKRIHKENSRLMDYLKRREAEANEEARRKAEVEAALQVPGGYTNGSLATPPMLPSPASITSTSSTTSTPTNRPSGPPEATVGNSNANGAPARPPQAPPSTQPQHPSRRENLPAPHFTVEVNSWYIGDRMRQCETLGAAAQAVAESERLLTLPMVAKHFPHTFARMMYSTLAATDEHEPDIEDEEGELCWPGQMLTGEGLGWVCAMGKAMIKEFGKHYGYRGVDAAIPKPKDNEEPSPPNEPPPPQPEPPAFPVQR